MTEFTEDRLVAASKAYLVEIQRHGQSPEESKSLLEELAELCSTLELEVVGSQIVRLAQPQPAYLIGSGKLEELKQIARTLGAGVLIFDDELSPAQQRNIERETGLATIDRREVILDIFAARATSAEARLQVALAKAEHSLPRLTRLWSHLSRQKGGGVNQKGEGESQLELDRRMIKARILKLKEELAVVRGQRDTQRKARRKRPVPNAAIVGYTNAGKSTLLNRLTQASVLADDKLFATLDPTTRRVSLPNNQELLLTDTVGFIRRLPHDLVEAFKSTLEEAALADFLVHVVDASDPQADEHMKTTLNVLSELGAEHKRTLTVFNKVDLLAGDELPLMRLRQLAPEAIAVSVHSGFNMDLLAQELADLLADELKIFELIVPVDRFDLVAYLHRSCKVEKESYEEEGVRIRAGIPPHLLGKVQPFVVSES
ncbi:MAG: GTPase HflX [Verrucomicrobiota bacterium]